MFSCYFRLSIEDAEEYGEEYYDSIEKWINAQASLVSKIEKIVYDFESEQKSIGILYTTDDRETAKQEILSFFKNNRMNCDVLYEESFEEEISLHSGCGHAHCTRVHVSHEDEQGISAPQQEDHSTKAMIGLAYGTGLLMLSLFGFQIPMMAYYVITIISALITLYLGHKIYEAAWSALLQQKMDMNTLYSISTLMILAMSLLSVCVPGVPMVLESAPLILGFLHLGESFEHKLLGDIKKQLDPRTCITDPKAKTYLPYEVITLSPGGVIPVDGVLLTDAWVDTSMLDGAINPRQFLANTEVRSGMRLVPNDNQIQMRVTKTYQQSYLSTFARELKACDGKAPIEVFANQVLHYFVPGLLVVAVVSGVLLAVFYSPAVAVQSVIAVLVSACPCALSLITPMAVEIGMHKAFNHKIPYKNGKALQAAAEIDTVVFDLNGTLTEGKIEVSGVPSAADCPLLTSFYSLESQSTHPVAIAIRDAIQIGTGHEIIWEQVDLFHSGVKGTVGSDVYMIGNHDFLKEQGIVLEQDIPHAHYMVHNQKVVATLIVKDRLRSSAKATIQQLRAMGKHVYLCTGADEVTAQAYANELGIVSVIAGMKDATAKQTEIKRLQAEKHRVCMVGDASNDTLALKEAQLGICVQSTRFSEWTENEADLVIPQDKLDQLEVLLIKAFEIGLKTKQNIFQNLIISLVYNAMVTMVASGALISFGITLSPALGVALMVIESLLVLGNLYRFKHEETLSQTVSEISSSFQLKALGSRF